MQAEDLLSGAVQPGGRAPAPPSLRLVQDFVNTVDREWGPDLLADAASARAWAGRRELLGPGARLGDEELAWLRDVREALRRELAVNAGEEGSPRARPLLDEALGRAGVRPRLRPHGVELESEATGVEGLVGAVLARALTAQLDGSWARLKACPRDVCGWAFYDRSPAASATWCSMRVCGNRTKASRYYRRRRVS